MDFTQKSRMRSVWIKLWWFEREIHSFSFKIILTFKKGPLTYLAAKHCCPINYPSGDLLKKTKEKSFRPVQYVLCERLFYREIGLFKYPWTLCPRVHERCHTSNFYQHHQPNSLVYATYLQWQDPLVASPTPLKVYNSWLVFV